MNKKINTICFIFLLFFLICAVSAADSENETLQITDYSDDSQDLCKISVENTDEELKSTVDCEKLEATKATVKKESVTLKAPDVKMHYKDGTTFKVTVKDKNKKAIGKAKIKISIDGKTYSKVTDKKGATSIKLNLKSGTYTVITNFLGSDKYESKSLKSKVTIKSTVKCSDLTKYYKNKSAYYSTFYDKKGKLLKNTNVKIKLKSKTYSIKTNAKGVAKLAVDLKPGKYSITSINSKTSESVSKSVTIKTLIVTKDLTVEENKKAKFDVKILNSNGKVSANKKVTIKLNGKTYTKKTDKNGIASLDINLEYGEYSITSEFDGLKSSNKITVKEALKKTPFSHIIRIPTYVNITHPYVFEGTGYVLKSGIDGIIKMPKNELFTVKVKDKEYLFSTKTIPGVQSTLIGYKTYLMPFDGSSMQSDSNKSNLKGNGILISQTNGYTEIEYRSISQNNTQLFGFYADKGMQNSETITYMENDVKTAIVNFYTVGYDELGLKYSLSKFYGRMIYDFNYKSYDELTYHNADLIKFANTGKSVEFSYFGNSIVGYPSKEDIQTKFIVNGVEELDKKETISYGLGEKYRKTIGFEVLQTYSIINEKVSQETLEKWVSLNSLYLNKFGVMNIYGMHLASLETTWLADKLADEYSKTFNVSWKRGHTATLLGGINLEDTYLNILNADMGMTVKGDECNVSSFKFINSLQLPNLEDYSLKEVAARFSNSTINSQDDIYTAVANSNYSMMQFGEMIYVFAEDGSESAIIFNSTSGVASVIQTHNNQTYKGSSVATKCDCCSVGVIPNDIISGIKDALKLFSPPSALIMDNMDKIHPMSKLAYKFLSKYGGALLGATGKAGLSFIGTMVFTQQVGVEYRNEMLEEKDWHKVMDKITFTRPGYLQSKKIYNIPNKKGGYDYIEVNINDDLSLDRDSAIYISDGNTKKLTKKETYKYFSDNYLDKISNLPTKYWDKSWKGIVK